jgi:hypothetical protein
VYTGDSSFNVRPDYINNLWALPHDVVIKLFSLYACLCFRTGDLSTAYRKHSSKLDPARVVRSFPLIIEEAQDCDVLRNQVCGMNLGFELRTPLIDQKIREYGRDKVRPWLRRTTEPLRNADDYTREVSYGWFGQEWTPDQRIRWNVGGAADWVSFLGEMG